MSQSGSATTMGLGKLAAGKGNLGLRTHDVPAPGPGEAMVRVIATGVCGTDLHIEDDEFPSEPPVTMGHEVTGWVQSVGSEDHQTWIGKRVALETYYSNCGRCEYCRSGRPNLCAERRSIGSRENGGFAGYIRVPVRNLWELPDHVGELAGALAEPLACVARCLCDPPVVDVGDEVMVIGPGTMGLLTAQVARASGGRVTVVGLDRDRQRLEVAKRLGLESAVVGEDEPPTPDVVCECSGAEGGAVYGLERIAKGGRYVQVGIFGKPISLPLDQVLYKEVTLTSGNASTPGSWRRALSLLQTGEVLLDPLITGSAAITDWERVFADVRSGVGVKFVLTPAEEG